MVKKYTNKYNFYIKKTKYNRKKKKQKSREKNIKTYKKYKKGGSSTSGSLLQLNSNSTIYKFPIFYFPESINISNQMNNGNNNNSYNWNQWYQNYINNNNPNSNFGSLTIEDSMK